MGFQGRTQELFGGGAESSKRQVDIFQTGKQKNIKKKRERLKPEGVGWIQEFFKEWFRVLELQRGVKGFQNDKQRKPLGG